MEIKKPPYRQHSGKAAFKIFPVPSHTIIYLISVGATGRSPLRVSVPRPRNVLSDGTIFLRENESFQFRGPGMSFRTYDFMALYPQDTFQFRGPGMSFRTKLFSSFVFVFLFQFRGPGMSFRTLVLQLAVYEDIFRQKFRTSRWIEVINMLSTEVLNELYNRHRNIALIFPQPYRPQAPSHPSGV